MPSSSHNKQRFPAGWRVATLREITIQKQATIDPGDFEDELFEYYSIPAYQENGRPILERGGNIGSVKFLLNPSTILFGKLNPRVEKVWNVAEGTAYRKIGSTEWIPMQPGTGVDADYLYFLAWSGTCNGPRQNVGHGVYPQQAAGKPIGILRPSSSQYRPCPSRKELPAFYRQCSALSMCGTG